MYVKADNKLSQFYTEIIEDELNVKEVKYADDVREFTSYTFKPQLKTVGPKYGKCLGGIQKYLASVDGNAAMDDLNANGSIKFDVDGTEVELTKDDLLITMAQKEGFASEADGGVTVVMDTNLSEELVEEGFAAEVISKIQTMRKEADFEVMDRIHVYYEGTDKIAEIFEKKGDFIAGEVLANEITKGGLKGYQKEWNINNEAVTLSVERI
jgi:isoleucyl-tRNA synthetase